MLLKLFLSIENYIQNKSKKEFYILITALMGLIFSLIFFYIIPPIDSINTLQKEVYENEKTAYVKNLILLQNLQEESKPKTLNFSPKDFQNLAIDNYELLRKINILNKKLHLEIVANVSNNQDGLEFSLQGEFEDFMEWLRSIESHYFVFIEDLHIFFEDEKLIYNLSVKNLGNML